MANRKVGSMRSVFAQLAVFTTDDDQANMDRAVHVAGILDTVKTAQARYREALLAHPDLAERLRRLTHLTRADLWNGYVPPREDSDGNPSSSPYRAGLVELVTEALTRNDDWQHGDDERLYAVPARFIKTPWKENHFEAKKQRAQQARINQLLDEGDDE